VPQWTFRKPDRCCQRRGELLKDGAAEQVRNEGHDVADAAPTRCVKWNLVHVFDDDIERWRNIAKDAVEVAMREQRKRVACTDAVYFDSIEPGVGRAPWPAAAHERDLVSRGGEPTEDFVHMNLSAACLWILSILPIHEQDAH
jgi:hypothetical protein